MNTLRRILVPTDFSAPAEAAAHMAVWLAERTCAEVHILHAWQLPVYLAGDEIMSMPRGPLTVERFAELAVRERMTAFVAALEGQIFTAMDHQRCLSLEQRVEVGPPAKIIQRIAEDEGFDLIVMGTHGRSGLQRWVMGSVAERVLRTAPCPVWTVGPESAAKTNEASRPTGAATRQAESQDAVTGR